MWSLLVIAYWLYVVILAGPAGTVAGLLGGVLVALGLTVLLLVGVQVELWLQRVRRVR